MEPSYDEVKEIIWKGREARWDSGDYHRWVNYLTRQYLGTGKTTISRLKQDVEQFIYHGYCVSRESIGDCLHLDDQLLDECLNDLMRRGRVQEVVPSPFPESTKCYMGSKARLHRHYREQ